VGVGLATESTFWQYALQLFGTWLRANKNDNHNDNCCVFETKPTPHRTLFFIPEDHPAVFDDIYEVVLADSPATRAIHRKIRYHVYCMERGYEDPAAYPTGEESDPWDDDAVQFVARERRSGRCVGAIRLILPRAVDFPIETLGCLETGAAAGFSRRQLGELSRVCLIRTPDPWMYRGPLTRELGQVPKNRELEVLVGLLRAAGIYGLRRGIHSCYLLVTDSFARLLRRFGFALDPVGAQVDHRGMRAPYLCALRESAESASARNETLRAFFARESMAYRHSSDIDEDTIDPDSLLIEPAVAA
jgi:N-acyl amino acid synthase of PEP-CTERM/exosortase system